MSGGHFNYAQFHISTIEEEIERILAQQGQKIPEDEFILSKDWYDEHPEDAFYPVYSDAMQTKMKEAVKVLKLAAIYAQRIDWFLSGDDGEESFMTRFEEEVKCNQ